MYLDHLSLHDFRSYREVEIDLSPGVIAFVGQNGQGKTNLIEAVDYLARLGSHRVSTDAALVRRGAEQALVRLGVVRDDRRATVEVEINPGRANRGRVNRSPLPRARDLLGWVRVVLFAPDDLVLVKGDPSDRRAFTDDLLVQAAPRYAGIKADYDRVLKQRNSLLKTAGSPRRGGSSAESALSTLAVWDARLAELGAEILLRRTALIDQLRPHLAETYAAVALGSLQENAGLSYKPCFDVDLPTREPTGDLDVAPTAEQSQAVAEQILAELEVRRRDELDRGLTLVGPHRDEVLFTLGEFPVKGYASHGETWSFALALRLASFELLRSNGDDPILILDDVFAELDVRRRERLAELVGSAEQVLVTAAVPADVPAGLGGVRFLVADSVVTADA